MFVGMVDLKMLVVGKIELEKRSFELEKGSLEFEEGNFVVVELYFVDCTHY